MAAKKSPGRRFHAETEKILSLMAQKGELLAFSDANLKKAATQASKSANKTDLSMELIVAAQRLINLKSVEGAGQLLAMATLLTRSATADAPAKRAKAAKMVSAGKSSSHALERGLAPKKAVKKTNKGR